MDTSRLRQVEEQIENMPTIGDLEQQILSQLDAGADFRQVADLILKDPVLTARVLGLANSPLYGVRGKISSIPLACTILGAKTLHSYILSVAFFGSVKSPYSREIICHSFGVAMLMHEEWNEPRKHFLTKGIGVYALSTIAADLSIEANFDAAVVCDEDYFVAKLADFLGDLDWSTSGPLRGRLHKREIHLQYSTRQRGSYVGPAQSYAFLEECN